MIDFYIYAHFKLNSNIPFYIGKGRKTKTGKLSRAYSNYHRNQHWHNVVNKYGYRVEIIYENLPDEDLAFAIESMLIRQWGRLDLKKGSLVIMTDGGDGASHSEETLQKLRLAMKGRKAWNKGISQTTKNREVNRISHLGQIPWNKGMKMPSDWIHPMLGKRHTEETKKHLSNIRKGRKRSKSRENV